MYLKIPLFFVFLAALVTIVACQSKDETQTEQNQTNGEQANSQKPNDDAIPKDMRLIPAGDFIMGTSRSYSRAGQPKRTVYLDTYWIDTTEVTVAAYRRCVDAKACTPADTTKNNDCVMSLTTENNWSVPNREDHPINCVTWTQAKTFCEWVGKRLPTEAEWEKAARGNSGFDYPWGNIDEPSCDFAVMMQNDEDGCGRKSTWPVGSKKKGESSSGVLNMAGNVSEWTADWYAPKFDTSQTRNPQGPESGKTKVRKGGTFNSRFGLHIMPATRYDTFPDAAFAFLGFRCAKNAM